MKMKKIIYFVILVLLVSAITSNTFKADSTKNLIDWSDFVSTDSYTIENKTPIEIENGETYTLVFDRSYNENFYEYLSLIDITFIFSDTNIERVKKISEDETKHLGYIQFVAEGAKLKIKNINTPSASSSYNLALYKGEYKDFNNFYFSSQEYIEIGEYYLNYDNFFEYDPGYNIPKYYILNPNIKTDSEFISSNLVKEVGQYEVIYKARDNNKNLDFFYKMLINIYDNTPPLINTVEISYDFTNKPTIEQFISDIIVSDNASSSSQITVSVLNQNFIEASSPGVYSASVKAEDSEGNFSTKNVNVILEVSQKPTITGPKILYYYRSDERPKVSDILALLTAKDLYGIDLQISVVSQTYNENVTTPGYFNIHIQTSDSYGNVTKETIYISIIDDRKPEFVFNNLVLQTKDEYLTEAEIILFIEEGLKELGFEPTNIQISNIEQINEKLSKVSYRYEDKNEIIYEDVLNINIIDQPKREVIVISIVLSSVVLISGVGIYFKIKRKRKINI